MRTREKALSIDLFLDLDGVLADFDAGLADLGVRPDPAANRSRAEMDAHERARKDAIYRRIAGTDFFRRLPPAPGAHALWAACRRHQPTILTAVPRFADPVHTEEAGAHKYAMVTRTFEALPWHRFITCTSREKPLHMRPGGRPQVLIDDRAANVRAWRQAGGAAIHHVDAATSIDQLRELLQGGWTAEPRTP